MIFYLVLGGEREAVPSLLKVYFPVLGLFSCELPIEGPLRLLLMNSYLPLLLPFLMD